MDEIPQAAGGTPVGAERSSEAFSLPGYRGLVCRRYGLLDLEGAVARVADPGAARKTLHWGRNYLYAVDLETADGTLPVVVKQFRNESVRARWRRRRFESKAETSWRVAARLLAVGVDTPEPVLLVESARPHGPSYYVSREVGRFFESRYLFRALADGSAGEEFNGVEVAAILGQIGRVLRRMHDGGVWHRDVTMGNVLITPTGLGEPPQIHLIDLNRARLDRRMHELRRLRDLCRLPILHPDHRRLFLGAYWGEGARGFGLRQVLFVVAVRGFLLKNRLKAALRAPLRGLARFRLRRAYPHIPPAPSGAGRRDRAVWDHLSDQPHQHARWLEKMREYAADAAIHGSAAVQIVPGARRALRRYSMLKRELYAAPVTFGGAGVGLRPWPDDPTSPVAAVEELGVDHALLRLHPWEESHAAELGLAAELSRRGVELTFALPQNRDLVRDPPRWRAAVERLGEAFLPYGNRFQIGQAVNRSKWGIWNYHEYLDLAAAAAETLRARGPVELLGPSVIDFELYATIALLNMRRGGCRFDGVASLLYVDRRGAPENRQLGFDTVGKVTLLKAIAETSRKSGDASWITEFNWPLREGPHAPAGRSVAIDEQRQADFLVRFLLMALGTGLVEGAFWWQAIAKGYGLIDPVDLRRRPAFRAFATMTERLRGASFLGPLATAEPGRLYLFSLAEGEEMVVGWSHGEPVTAELPRRPRAAWSRDGEPVAPPDARVELGSSPRYLLLDGE